MANKYSTLRKKLIKESIVLVVAMLVLGGGGFALQNFAEETLGEQQLKENEVTASRAKLAELRKEMEGGQSQVSLYNKYIVSHNPNLTLNREEMTKWLVEQREKFHLLNLSITIPPFTDIKDAFPVKSGILIKSEVKLAFSALTDNSVFALIAEMQRKAPGIVVMQDIKLTHTGNLTSSVLLDLTQHRLASLVTAELTFNWIGLRSDVKPDDTAKAGADSKGSVP